MTVQMKPGLIAQAAARSVINQSWNDAILENTSGLPQGALIPPGSNGAPGASPSIFQNKFYWLGIGALTGLVGVYLLSPKRASAGAMAGLRGMHPMMRSRMMGKMRRPMKRRRSGNVTRRNRRRR